MLFSIFDTAGSSKFSEKVSVLSKIARRGNIKEAKRLLQIESLWRSLSKLLESKGEDFHEDLMCYLDMM